MADADQQQQQQQPGDEEQEEQERRRRQEEEAALLLAPPRLQLVPAGADDAALEAALAAGGPEAAAALLARAGGGGGGSGAGTQPQQQQQGGVFIGDVKLSEVKQALARAGIPSAFRAGKLLCAGAVVVSRSDGAGGGGSGAGGGSAGGGSAGAGAGAGGGALVIEGPLSEEYYRVRDVVYGQVRRGAVWTGRGQGGKGGRKGQEQGVSYRELPAVACQRRSTLTHSCNLLPAPTNASTTVPSVLIRRRRV